MKPSIRLGKIAGINVGIHYSFFGILLLVSWSLSQGLLPDRFPGWSVATYWATGIVAALMLFASVLVHELAHSVVAKARGFDVEGITLFLLGGVSNLRSDARRPRDEFVVSAVGPLTSFALSLVFWAALLSLQERQSPIAALAWYLALINLLLGAFNLLPAFPLDGGRVLRSIVWALTGSLPKATNLASFIGQGFGLLLILAGAIEVFGGSYWEGLWIALIGWFLHGSAGASRREVSLSADAIGVLVKEVMDADPVTIAPDRSISDAVYGYFLGRGSHALLVCEGDRLLGIISLTDIRRIPQIRWSAVRVVEEMTQTPLWYVGPNDDLQNAMTLLGEHSVHQVPVLEAGRLVGLLSRAHIIRYFHSRRELRLGRVL